MTEHNCGNCNWHKLDDETQTGKSYCTAENGPQCGDWTTDEFTCGLWEPQRTFGKGSIKDRLLAGDWHDMTVPQIAKALGATPGSISTYLSDLRKAGHEIDYKQRPKKPVPAPAGQPIEKIEQLESEPEWSKLPAGATILTDDHFVDGDKMPEASITDLAAECPTISETETVGRAECLDKAKACVTGHREQDYGKPEDNFAVIARLWSAYLDCEIDNLDVANMMILQKMGRITSGTATADSYVDIAGYAACGCEIATGN